MDASRNDPAIAALRIVKIVHTLVWALFAGCIVAIPIVAWRRNIDGALALIAIVGIEVLVLVVNRLRCPLTGIAARYTADRRDNFDIFLPLWLARYNKHIFGALFAGGILYTAIIWRVMRGQSNAVQLCVCAVCHAVCAGARPAIETFAAHRVLEASVAGRSTRALGVPPHHYAAVRLRLLAWVGCSLLVCVPGVVDACGTSPRATFDTFIGAFNKLDWASFQSCLADTASLFNPDIPGAVSLHRLDGRAEVERSFRAVFDAAANGQPPRGPNIHPDKVSWQIFSETALVTFEFWRSDRSFGRRSLVLVRERGSWKIMHIHASNVTVQP